MKHNVEQLTEDAEITSGGQKKTWAAGSWKATIDLEDGSPVSNYYGATEKDVLDQVLTAQGHASKKIKELKRERQTPPPRAATAPPATSQPLTTDQAFKLTNDLNDPSKAPAAVGKLVESQIGVPLETIRDNAKENLIQRMADDSRAAAESFIEANPDYKVCPHNSGVICRYIELQKWDFTDVNSYQQAFNQLSAQGLLLLNTAADGEQPEATAPPAASGPASGPQTRPRAAAVSSSGLRSSNGSGTTIPRKKITRAELERMPATEYNRRLKEEPGFRAQVDAL